MLAELAGLGKHRTLARALGRPLGDNPDHAAGGAIAIQHRAAAADNLDPFHRLDRNGRQHRAGQLVFAHAHAVEHDDHILAAVRTETAQIERKIRACVEALAAVHAADLADRLVDVGHAGAPDLVGGNDGGADRRQFRDAGKARAADQHRRHGGVLGVNRLGAKKERNGRSGRSGRKRGNKGERSGGPRVAQCSWKNHGVGLRKSFRPCVPASRIQRKISAPRRRRFHLSWPVSGLASRTAPPSYAMQRTVVIETASRQSRRRLLTVAGAAHLGPLRRMVAQQRGVSRLTARVITRAGTKTRTL